MLNLKYCKEIDTCNNANIKKNSIGNSDFENDPWDKVVFFNRKKINQKMFGDIVASKMLSSELYFVFKIENQNINTSKY